jgi:hypothetical protein
MEGGTVEMIPSKTVELLGSSMHQALRNDPGKSFLITGTDLNDLRALAMRFDRPFADANEKRDWQNRINLICGSAIAV